MIQELLGTPTLIGGERKIPPFNGGIILEGTPNPPLPSPWAPPSSSYSATAVPGSGVGVGAGVGARVDTPPPKKNHSSNPSNSSPGSESNNNNNNLRCPRCDSSNTKFCYYNNYNLTQPRHFCKTCRRYWTKGGALRNVPIGGGCRKNRPLASSSAAIGSTSSKSGGSKFKTLVTELGRPGLVPGFNHDNIVPPTNSVFWATGTHNSQILSLLKGNQSPSHNHGGVLPAPVFFPFKEETNLLGSHLMPEPAISAHSVVNARSLGIEPLGHRLYHHQQQNGVIISGEISNTGLQSLYHGLEAPRSNNYYPESTNNRITLGIQRNTVSTDTQSPSSPILESVPAATTSELGYWNPAFSMSDLATTNGAYP